MEGQRVTSSIEIDSMEQLVTLFGNFDRNVTILRNELGVDMAAADNRISITGEQEQVAIAGAVITRLLSLIRRKEPIDPSRIRYAISLVQEGNEEQIEEIMSGVVAITYRGKQIKTKTMGQKTYVEAMKKNPVVLCVGPAGTGKTYLAMAMAVTAFKNKEITRIILTRPAVEAGEHLGFLPGDLQQKVDPYLRPLYDAVYEMLGVEAYQKMLERGSIEVAPLAYMRGRTLSEAFIILDEAQNTTQEQMKMFLTRMGIGSRVVVTGDVTQIDLPTGKRSGLREAVEVLRGVEGVQICALTARDVVRHELVQNIIHAYERHEKKKG